MNMRKRYLPIGRPVEQQVRWWAISLAQQLGPVAAAKTVGVTRGTYASVMAGLAVAATTEARFVRARERAERRAA